MALPKYLTDGPSKQKKSQTQEKRLAKDLSGKVQRGSGAKTFHKGDVKSMELLVEAKRTDKDSMSVKKDWLIKIFRESVAYNKTPAFALEFDTMPDIVPRDWVAIPSKTLAMLMEFYKAAMDDEPED